MHFKCPSLLQQWQRVTLCVLLLRNQDISIFICTISSFKSKMSLFVGATLFNYKLLIVNIFDGLDTKLTTLSSLLVSSSGANCSWNAMVLCLLQHQLEPGLLSSHPTVFTLMDKKEIAVSASTQSCNIICAILCAIFVCFICGVSLYVKGKGND